MRRTLAAVALVALLLGSGGVVAAEYTVSVDGAMDVPDRTVSVAGETYQVSSLAQVARGEQLTAETTGDDDGYRVYVHDADGDIVDQQYVFPADDGFVSFDTSPYEPGTYVLSAYHDGTYHDPLPVVVPAYDVSAAVPSHAGGDDTVEVSVTLAEREAGHAVDGVTVVVSNETVTRRYDAEHAGDEYTANFEGDTLPAGTYSVYAVATGSDDFPGPTNELIGVSDSSQLTVESRSNGTEASDSPGGTATAESSDQTDSDQGAEESDIDPDDAESGDTEQRETASDGTESDDTVISPEPESDEPESTERGLASAVEERAGGVSFALFALLTIVGALALRSLVRSP